MKVFYIVLIFFILIIMGQYNSKVALALAGLILLSSVIINKDSFKKIMEGDVF